MAAGERYFSILLLVRNIDSLGLHDGSDVRIHRQHVPRAQRSRRVTLVDRSSHLDWRRRLGRRHDLV